MDWKSLEVQAQEGRELFVVARPSLVLGLFGGLELLAAAELMLNFWLRMRVPEVPLFGLGANARSFRPVNATALKKLRASMATGESVDFYMLKDAPGFDIGRNSLQFAFSHEPALGEQARVAMAFPPQLGEQAQCEGTAEAVLALLHEVKPQQAFASLGFSLVFGSEYEAVALPQLFATCKRLTGLDLPERFTETRLKGRLKSAYWITGARQELLQKQGVSLDPQGLHAAGIAVRHDADFVSCRAGTCPPLGDRNRKAPDMASVKALHAALHPALLQRWASPNVFGFGVEDIDSWFSRFDI